MTESDIERIVALTLQRLHPPALLLVSEERDYRQIVQARLASCDCAFRIAHEEGTEDEQWKALGQMLPANDLMRSLAVDAYHVVVVPFMSYSLAADVANGALHTPFAQAIHQALCRGVLVLALRYYCDPLSELNQLKGSAANPGYIEHMQATLATLKRVGVMLCTIDELMTKLVRKDDVIHCEKTTRRYITVNDIIKNSITFERPGALLTDAASDYIKNKKR